MGRPYSEDLRSRIVAAVEGGVSRNAAARQFAGSVSCVVKLLQRFRRTGRLRLLHPARSLMRGFHDCLPGTPARTVGHLLFPRFEGSASPRRASQYEDRNRHQRVARDPS